MFKKADENMRKKCKLSKKMKLLEIRHIVSEMKNIPQSINSRIDTTKEKIGELEDIARGTL